MWANIARKAKDASFNRDAPPKSIVIAPISQEDENENIGKSDITNVAQRTVVNLSSFEKGILVLDTNAFIKGLEEYCSLCDLFVTTPQVIKEIKDSNARNRLENLPLRMDILDPTPEAILEVIETAKQTGDFGTMGRTDIRLCALALDCSRATNSLKSKILPTCPVINPTLFNNEVQSVTEAVSDGEESEKEDSTNNNNEENNLNVNTSKAEDDEGEWITSENIRRISSGLASGNGDIFNGKCGCVTSDFSMQNTLLHLGVSVVGPNGMCITELRTWLLRCHACYCIVSDTTRQFCPDCGSGNTLRRVQYFFDDKGNKKLFINFKRQISKRGTVYNLPNPRGGKHGTNRGLVLREDQLAHIVRGSKSSAQIKAKEVLEDEDLAVFGEIKPKKKYDISQPKTHSSYARYNVNDAKKAKASRKK